MAKRQARDDAIWACRAHFDYQSHGHLRRIGKVVRRLAILEGVLMKAHSNAQKLIRWLRQNQPATVAQIAANGVMNSRDASDAVQYGVRHGVFDRIKRPGASANERVQYRLTGQSLPALKSAPVPSFDGLLQAWGIARTPPRLRAPTSRKLQMTD
ncbi:MULTISPECIES: hypothetical protein [Paraburkholderia]|uniref:Uncharacterized protein n=1 Tax=Paraburkholderia podalyriae TaxID=1938811 RepID=A0ABR7PYF8_9BURK|nr:hypothetical protein [Paraburkholderia podalyriae]MBC8751293.1 hypothetical protein [Paraburkholderia podalyriae]